MFTVPSFFLNSTKQEGLEIRDITGDIDLLNRYLDLAGTIEGVRYPTAYITEQGKCFAMFKGDKIIGGYVIIYSGPFRTLEAAKTLCKDKSLLNSVDPDDLVELGGLWMDPNDSNYKSSTRVWAHMYGQIVGSGKTNMIYGYKLDRKGLSKMYSQCRPVVLFRGELPGKFEINTHNSASLEYCSVLNWRICFFREYAKRLFKIKKTRGIYKKSNTVPSNQALNGQLKTS